MKVFVYFNLHRHLWSVRALEGPQKGRVIAHQATVKLANCTLKVSAAGRQRVLKEKTKNVHAGVVGSLVAEFPPECPECNVAVRYNPYLFSSFVFSDTLEEVHHAPYVLMANRKAFVPAVAKHFS